MKRQIKKHLRDFIAIVSLVVLAVAVGGYILANQRVTLPGWMPFVGQEFYEVKAEFKSGQAVMPGQGQAVKISGVKVGTITDVQLNAGRALISMQIKKQYAPIYRDATMLLSPNSLLKDENIALDPGTPSAGELASGATLPQSSTNVDVNFDELLSALDADTRQYLQILLAAGGDGLKGNGANLSRTLGQLNLTSQYLGRINSGLAKRRHSLARLVHNFQLLINEVGSKDQELAQLVDSVNANFQAFASQDEALQRSVGLLPGTLETTRDALGKADRVATILGPTLERLRPGARALAPALRQLRPFFAKTEPVIRTQIRPFTGLAMGPVRDLEPVASRLAQIVPDFELSVEVLNYLFNALAYDPPGSAKPYLFWMAWASHNVATVMSAQDASSTVSRGLLSLACAELLTIGAKANSSLPAAQDKAVTILYDSLGLPSRDALVAAGQC